MITVTPKVTNEMLINPGIGFIAAPRLMGGDGTGLLDNRGSPVDGYKFTETSRTWNHPDSGVYFCHGVWRELEPAQGQYNWSVIDRQLEAAEEMGCICVMRAAPHRLTREDDDIPAWLRERWPEDPEFPFWLIDPNTTDYAERWAEFISAYAERYNGHPLICSVDLTIAGAWGEGGGTEFIDCGKIETIVDAYVNGFTETPMQALLHDPRSVEIIRSKNARIGFRVDCLGDMGGFAAGNWSHMLDFYPQNICNFKMEDAWKKAPVVFEACWHMNDWFLQGWDIDYIIEESLKWHISSFNAKGTTVPEPWRDSVERWVARMGYRFELHRCRFSEKAVPGGAIDFEMLISNSGVAPCYHNYPPVLRLSLGNGGRQTDVELKTDAQTDKSVDIRNWMPGEDNLLHLTAKLPQGLTPGSYEVSIGFPVPRYNRKTLMLANERRDENGFYPLGTVEIEK